MYLKPNWLRYEKNLTLNDTLKFDELPKKGKCSGLIFWIRTPTTSGQHYGIDGKTRLVDYVDQVQFITNGKRPLKDLTGAQVQGLNFLNTGEVPGDLLTDPSLGPQYCQLVIPFGRFIGDLEHYLNWEDYSSAELDVKNSLSSTIHVSASYGIQTVDFMDADALPASKGVFMERNWREKSSTTADETEYYKPPTGSKYRRLVIQAIAGIRASAPYRRKTNNFDVADEIKLKFLDGKEVAYDGYSRYLAYLQAVFLKQMAETFGKLLGSTDGASSGIVNTGIGYRFGSHVSPAEIATTLTERNYGIYTYADDLMPIYSDTGTNPYVDWRAKGVMYQNMLPLFPLVRNLDDVDHYLDTEAKDPIDLEIKTKNDANATGGKYHVIISELVAS